MTIKENSTTEHRTSVTRKPKPAKQIKPDKIRAELNIEKWPAIWHPSSSKLKPESRVLASLTAEQYRVRFDTALRALHDRPYLARLPAGSKVVEVAVRARMMETLEKEPTDLVSFDPELLVRFPWLQPKQ